MSARDEAAVVRFIDAVLDHPVSEDVAALGLRVRDVVTLARWLAPVAIRFKDDPKGGTR